MNKQEQEIVAAIQQWDGTVNTRIGKLLRDKTYGCFNSLIPKIGRELSNAINMQATPEAKLQLIKTILAKHNIYNEGYNKT